jgi:L-ascorbate oxidase
MHRSFLFGVFGLIAPLALAAPSFLEPRQEIQPCKFNSSVNATCWDEKFNLFTDYYEHVPDGKERTFEFELKEVTMDPDGFPRKVLALNGQIPGPTINVTWGDTVGEFIPLSGAGSEDTRRR